MHPRGREGNGKEQRPLARSNGEKHQRAKSFKLPPVFLALSLLCRGWLFFPLFVLFVFSDILFPYRYCSERARGTRAKEPTAKNARERTDCEERARKNRLRESARVTSSVRRSTSVAASLTESLLLRQVGVHSDLIFYHYCYIFYIYFLFIHLFSLFTFIFSFSYLILFNIFLFRLQFALALGTSKTSRDISPHFPTEGYHGCAQSFRDNSERTYHNSCRGQQRDC